MTNRLPPSPANMTPAERRHWQVPPAGGPAPTRSVRGVLAYGGADIPRLAAFPQKVGILQWGALNGQAIECCLDVGPIYLPASTATYRQQWFAAEVGNGVGNPTEVFALELEYGAGGTQTKTVLIDCKPGLIALPPCAFVRLALVNRNSDGSAGVVAIEQRVTVTLVEGVSPQAAQATYSMGRLENGSYAFPNNAESVAIIHPGRIEWGPALDRAGRIIQECTAAVPLVSPPWSPVQLPFQDVALGFTYTNEPVAALKGLLCFNLGL